VSGKTLLERREAQLKVMIDDVLERAAVLRKCVEGGYSDVNDRLRDLASAAHDARLIAAKVDDLRDVERYGPEGGRG
jgi:hypothetical protein